MQHCAMLVGKKLEDLSCMRVEKGKVRAPEIGRVWLNSTPLSFRQLRGRVVLVDFWDYTCVNCIRTLPYVQAWHERYRDKGLTVIGVHTPEFTFAQYESNVERGIREFGLTYPIVIDSNREIWKAFANRYWPTKYLLDKDGYLRCGPLRRRRIRGVRAGHPGVAAGDRSCDRTAGA